MGRVGSGVGKWGRPNVTGWMFTESDHCIICFRLVLEWSMAQFEVRYHVQGWESK